MFLHYIKSALKSCFFHKLYTCINILGLGVSLAICIIIFLFVRHELSYDSHFEDSERIYLIGQLSSNNPYGSPAASSGLVAEKFPGLFPLIESTTRTSYGPTIVVESPQLKQIETSIFSADEKFFIFFNFEWLYGNPQTALVRPNSIVLTAELARKYFKSEELAFGNTLLLDNDRLVQVTGIIKNLPDNTQFSFSALTPLTFVDSWESKGSLINNEWHRIMFETYALLHEEADVVELQSQVDEFSAIEFFDVRDNVTFTFTFTGLTDIYLNRAGVNRANRLKIFSGVAIAILLIAMINFMNLATASGARKVMEVGLRKTVGANRGQLVRQFLTESVVTVAFAVILGLTLAELFLPTINSTLHVNLALSDTREPHIILLLMGLVLSLGVISGSYPALFLTAVRPVSALRKEAISGKSGQMVRNILVVFQFTVSIVLIITTWVFLNQVDYLRSVDSGFDSEQVLTMVFPENNPLDLNTQWFDLRQKLLANSGVIAAVHSATSPLPEGLMLLEYKKTGDDERYQVDVVTAEPGYLEFYGVKLIAGEYFVSEGFNDGSIIDMPLPYMPLPYSEQILINQTALHALQWQAEEAIGKTMRINGPDGELLSTVIGVVENTISNAHNKPVAIIYMQPENANYRFFPGRINIRITPQNVTATLEHIDAVWNEFFPEHPIQRAFLDDRIEAQLQTEKLHLQLFSYATFFAISVACFGLFGLATFNTERRTKEIGIRKVMGGSVWSVVLLLTRDFSKLVLISNLIAWPIAYIAMSIWLEGFAYRMELSVGVFIGSGFLALIVAWMTVGVIAAKAANAKPILALRYE